MANLKPEFQVIEEAEGEAAQADPRASETARPSETPDAADAQGAPAAPEPDRVGEGAAGARGDGRQPPDAEAVSAVTSAGRAAFADDALSGYNIGVILRQARVRQKKDLEDIAKVLRIRKDYLQAIEDGRSHDLPGPTYTVGFVRAYASYLGLDGDDAVRRVKEESEDIQARTELVFPSAVTPARPPLAMMGVVLVLLAALIYGIWYLLPVEDSFISGDAAAPAEKAQAEASAPATAAPAKAASSEKTAAPAKPAAPEKAAPEAQVSAPAQAAPAPTVRLPETAPVGTSAQPPAQPPAQPSALPSETGTTVPRAAESPEQAPARAAEPEPETELPVAPTEVPPAAGQVEQAATGAAAPESHELAPGPTEEAATSRVMITVTADSWVQIRTADGRVLLTRLLRAGDSYAVPDGEPGLTLLAGNAGAINLSVDGKPVPPIGPSGAVRRNVSLDPDILLQQAGGAE